MAGENITLDPEFEAILREVASEPGSILLRVPRPAKLRALFDRTEPVSAHATGLSAAERHLLIVHRNEAAWLLRQAALHEYYEGARTRRVVNRFVSDTCKSRLPTREIASRAADLPKRLQSTDGSTRERTAATPWSATPSHIHDEIRGAHDMLIRYLTAPSGRGPSASALAGLSLRLEPTNQARLVASVDLAQSGSPSTALQLAWQILAGHPSADDAVRAWECAGSAHAKLDNLGHALADYRAACVSSPASFQPQMNRLVFGIQLRSEHDVVESSRCLGELISPDHPALVWFAARQLEDRHAGEWVPQSQSVSLARHVGDSLNETARRIANVFV